MLYILLLLLVILSIALHKIFKIVSGYGAKIVCSGVFVCRRTPEDLIKNELGYFPLNISKLFIDYENKTVTASVMGLAKKKAIFRQGLGATLINGIHEEELRAQHFNLAPPPNINQDLIEWPNGNLTTKLPYKNFDQHRLDQALNEAFTEPDKEVRKTRAVLVLYDGEIVAERYAASFSANSKFGGWSMAKSITGALIGILAKNNALDINAPAPVKEWQGDKRKDITIKHLLQMSSGLRWWEYYAAPSDATNMLYNEKNMGEFALRKKLKHLPGTKFKYSSGTTNILSKIVRESLNIKDYYRFPYKQLFYKVGMLNTVLEVDAGGSFAGSSYCFATARDWARFGLLYMNDGIWNGERILPEGWVKFSTTPTTAESGKDEGRYGAQWWLNAPKRAGDVTTKKFPNVPEDCFSCQGHEGQYVWVIPSEKLIIVRLALEKDKSLNPDIFIPSVIEAFKQ